VCALSETFKITSPIVSEVGITVAVQPNDQRFWCLNVRAPGFGCTSFIFWNMLRLNPNHYLKSYNINSKSCNDLS